MLNPTGTRSDYCLTVNVLNFLSSVFVTVHYQFEDIKMSWPEKKLKYKKKANKYCIYK